MGEVSILSAQNGLRTEKLLARALAQMQSICADEQVHPKSATINIPNENEAEPLAPANKSRGGGRSFSGHYNHGCC